MLYVRPEAVRREFLEDFQNAASAMGEEFEVLRPYGRIVGLGWQMQDLNPLGAALYRMGSYESGLVRNGPGARIS